jgi:cupin-like protein
VAIEVGSAALAHNTVPVVAASELDARTFREEFLNPGLPVVIRGAAAPEEVFSLEAFRREMAAREVFVCEHGKLRGPKWRWSRYAYQYPLRVEEYLRMIEDGRAAERDIYLSFLRVGDIGSAASARLFLDSVAERYGFERLYPDMEGYLWIGPVGHVEPLHTDEGDNTLYQIAGVKHLAIFPPDQIHNLYPFPLIGPLPPWVSQVDIDRPDPVRFPRVGEALAKRHDVVLEPGNMLFLPTQWSHEVTIVSGEPCISVNRQWKIAPWRRNFCTSRSTLWYLKRKLPRRVIIGAHSLLATLRKPSDSIQYTSALRRDQGRKTKAGE